MISIQCPSRRGLVPDKLPAARQEAGGPAGSSTSSPSHLDHWDPRRRREASGQ
jgi:hypothetical protein